MSRPNSNRLSTRATLLVLAGLLALPSTLLGGFWLLSGEHQVLPGLTGCRFVRDRQAQIDCYTGQFRSLIDDRGLAGALKRVDKVALQTTTLGADCHLSWHPIGEKAGVGDAAAGRGYDNIHAASTCQQGYAHGYTIGYLERARPRGTELARIVSADCKVQDSDLNLLNCVHAYGHSFARRVKQSEAKGVEWCGRVDYDGIALANSHNRANVYRSAIVRGMQHQCLYGLYMEMGILDVSSGGAVRNNCTHAPSKAARKACYAYLPSRVAAIDGNLAAGARACHTMAPKGDLRDSCVKTFSYGLDRRSRCDLLVARAEQNACLWTFELRDREREGAFDLLEAPSDEPAPRAKDMPAPPGAGAPPKS